MGVGFTPELKRLLREAGCTFAREGKGDHEIWRSPINGLSFVVDGRIGLDTPPMPCFDKPDCRSGSEARRPSFGCPPYDSTSRRKATDASRPS